MRKCRCMLSSRGASRLRLLMRPRVATYYVKPKEKKGPSGQAWALLAGVTVSITGLGIYILGMGGNYSHNFAWSFVKLKRLTLWGWSGYYLLICDTGQPEEEIEGMGQSVSYLLIINDLMLKFTSLCNCRSPINMLMVSCSVQTIIGKSEMPIIIIII